MTRRRVVLIGPECSGKTTLAAHLAAHFGVPWTPEAARRFAEQSRSPLSLATVGPIARLSMSLEDAIWTAPHGTPPRFLVRDTDLVSTVVYSHHYYGHCEPWIEAEARARVADLYLLCAPDLPWTPDGIRDRPEAREALYAQFAERLALLRARVSPIGGVGSARTRAAELAVERARVEWATDAPAT